MKKQKFRKTQLSLALTTALAGGVLASGPAQAVELENNDRLGDAGIFQYYTAHSGWQTFFRIINTSENPVSVKLRFHEGANSREVLDFIVFLSGRDMWSAWTTADALGDGSGPGIRTNDTSCVFGGADSNNTSPPEGWRTLANGTLAARFLDKAYTGDYDDGGNANVDPLARKSEGYLEVIGIAEHDPLSDFGLAVTHPIDEHSCVEAATIYKRATSRGERNPTAASDMGNVLGFNGYLINVAAGQGGGYDPDVLANFARDRFSGVRMVYQSLLTDAWPNLDSGDPDGFARFTPAGFAAVNQWDAEGNKPASGNFRYLVDINGDGDYTDTGVAFDANSDGTCSANERYDESNAPPAAWNTNITAAYQIAGTDYCYAISQPPLPPVDTNLNITFNKDDGGVVWYPKQSQVQDVAGPVKIAQNGDQPDTPVLGGVDWVSWELMRNSVINEWAASYKPSNFVSDYFTQWVLTFPTKNFYVDLQDDPKPTEDISPTLQDTLSEYAFAPFTYKFKDEGKSCVPYTMDMWNREEAYAYFTSPASDYPVDICYEVNVVNFNERYTDLGLDSNFGVTVPIELLPTDWDGATSERGWAEMSYAYDAFGEQVDGAMGALVGLLKGEYDYHKKDIYGVDEALDLEEIKPIPLWRPEAVRLGLPVTGFLFSVYNTNSSANNHAAINAHKYDRIEYRCRYSRRFGDNGINLCSDDEVK
jgi:hypothetical protein